MRDKSNGSRAVEVSIPFLVTSEDHPTGNVIIVLPTGAEFQVESLGRDGDGVFIRTDSGDIVRVTEYEGEIAELDEVLSRRDVFAEVYDAAGALVAQYAVGTIPYGLDRGPAV